MVQQLWDIPQVFCISIELQGSPLKNLNAYVVRSGDDIANSISTHGSTWKTNPILTRSCNHSPAPTSARR